MKQYFVLTDSTDNSIYGIAVKSDDRYVVHGAHGRASEWATWVNAKNISSLDGYMPVDIIASQPRSLKSDDNHFIQGLLDSVISGGIKPLQSKHYIDSYITNQKSTTPTVRDYQLGAFPLDGRQGAITFKALAFKYDQRIQSFSALLRTGRAAFDTETGLVKSRIADVSSSELQASIDSSLSRIAQRRIGLETNIYKKSIYDHLIETKKLGGRIGSRLGRGLRAAPPGMVFVDITGAIDADTDGIVFEGKPGLERPIIPRFTLPEALGRRISAAIQGDAENNEKLRRTGSFNEANSVAKLRELLGQESVNVSEVDATSAIQRPKLPIARTTARRAIMQNRGMRSRSGRRGFDAPGGPEDPFDRYAEAAHDEWGQMESDRAIDAAIAWSTENDSELSKLSQDEFEQILEIETSEDNLRELFKEYLDSDASFDDALDAARDDMDNFPRRYSGRQGSRSSRAIQERPVSERTEWKESSNPFYINPTELRNLNSYVRGRFENPDDYELIASRRSHFGQIQEIYRNVNTGKYHVRGPGFSDADITGATYSDTITRLDQFDSIDEAKSVVDKHDDRSFLIKKIRYQYGLIKSSLPDRGSSSRSTRKRDFNYPGLESVDKRNKLRGFDLSEDEEVVLRDQIDELLNSGGYVGDLLAEGETDEWAILEGLRDTIVGNISEEFGPNQSPYSTRVLMARLSDSFADDAVSDFEDSEEFESALETFIADDLPEYGAMAGFNPAETFIGSPSYAEALDDYIRETVGGLNYNKPDEPIGSKLMPYEELIGFLHQRSSDGMGRPSGRSSRSTGLVVGDLRRLDTGNSRAVKALTWNNKKKELTVTYIGDRTYTYSGVPDNLIAAIEQGDEPIGRIVNQVKQQSRGWTPGGSHVGVSGGYLSARKPSISGRSRTNFNSMRSSGEYSGPSLSNGVMPSWTDLGRMSKVNGPTGSNGGQWYEDVNNGRKFFVKPTPSPDHAFNEAAVAAVYRAAGAAAPNIAVITDSSGKNFIISEGVPNLTSTRNISSSDQRTVKLDMGIDMLLSNWDVFGGGDNTKRSANGAMYRLDTGGGGLFRARGGSKPSFNPTDPWIEPATMVYSRGGQSQYLYGRVTNAEFVVAMDKVVNLNLGAIDREMQNSGVPDSMRKHFMDTIIARQKKAKQYVELFSKYDRGARVNVSGNDITPGGNKVSTPSPVGKWLGHYSNRSIRSVRTARSNPLLSYEAPEQDLLPETYDGNPSSWGSAGVLPNTLNLIRAKREAQFKSMIDRGMEPEDAADLVIDTHARSNMRMRAGIVPTSLNIAAYGEYADGYDSMLEDIDGWPAGLGATAELKQLRSNRDRIGQLDGLFRNTSSMSSRSVRWRGVKSSTEPKLRDDVRGTVVSRGNDGSSARFEIIQTADGRFVISGVERMDDGSMRQIGFGIDDTNVDDVARAGDQDAIDALSSDNLINSTYDSADEAIEAINNYVDGPGSSYDDEMDDILSFSRSSRSKNGELLSHRSAVINEDGLLERPAHGFHYADFERMSDRQLVDEYQASIMRGIAGENTVDEIRAAQKALEDRRLLAAAIGANNNAPLTFDGSGRATNVPGIRKSLASARSGSSGNYEANMTLGQLSNLERDALNVRDILALDILKLNATDKASLDESFDEFIDSMYTAIYAVDSLVVSKKAFQDIEGMSKKLQDMALARKLEKTALTSEQVSSAMKFADLIDAISGSPNGVFVTRKLDELGSMHDIFLDNDREKSRLGRILGAARKRRLDSGRKLGSSYIESRSRRTNDARRIAVERDAFIESNEFDNYFKQFRKMLSSPAQRRARGISGDREITELDYINSPEFLADVRRWNSEKIREAEEGWIDDILSTPSSRADLLSSTRLASKSDVGSEFEAFSSRSTLGKGKDTSFESFLSDDQEIDRLRKRYDGPYDTDWWELDDFREYDRARYGDKSIVADNPDFNPEQNANVRRISDAIAESRQNGTPFFRDELLKSEQDRELARLIAGYDGPYDTDHWDLSDFRAYDRARNGDKSRYASDPDLDPETNPKVRTFTRDIERANKNGQPYFRPDIIRAENERIARRAEADGASTPSSRSSRIALGSPAERRRIATIEQASALRSMRSDRNPGHTRILDTDGSIWESLSGSDQELVRARSAEVEEALIEALTGKVRIRPIFDKNGQVIDVEVEGTGENERSKFVQVSTRGNEYVGLRGIVPELNLVGTATELERRARDEKEKRRQAKIKRVPFLEAIQVVDKDGNTTYRVGLNSDGLAYLNQTYVPLRKALVEKLDALKDNEKEKRNKILKEIALLDHRVTALKTLANARLKGIDGKNADGGDFLAYVPEQLPTDVRRSLLFGSGSYTDFGRVKRDVFNAWRTGKAKAGTKEHRDLSDKFERGELDADLFAWWNKATPATLRDKGIPSSEDYLDEQGMLRPGIVQSVTAPGDVDLDAPHSAKQLGFDVPGIAPNRYESNRTGGFWSTRLFKLFRPNNEEWLQKQREIDQKRLKNLKKGSAGFGGEREEIERSKKELRILRKRKAERLKFMRDAEGKPRSSDEIKSIHDDKRATFTELVTVQDDGSVEISDDGVKALAEAQILKPGRTQVADSKDKESRDERKEREKVEKAIKSRNKKEDVALAHFWEKARFNEKPTVVSEEEFIEQAKQPGAIVIRRGVGGRTFANDYLDDDNRYTTRRGGVMQGPGEYWAVRVDDGKDVRGTSEGWNAYVSADNQGGKPGTEPGPGGIMAVLPADAKIITKAELQQIRTDLGKVAGPLKVAFDSPLLPKDLRNKIAGKNAEQLLELIDSEVLGKIPLDDPRWKTAAGQMILQLINKAKSGNEATRKDALSALAFLIGGLDGHLQNMLAPIFGYDAIRADSGVMLVMNRGALIAYGGVGGLSLTNAVERAVLEGSRVPTDIAKKANNGERVD